MSDQLDRVVRLHEQYQRDDRNRDRSRSRLIDEIARLRTLPDDQRPSLGAIGDALGLSRQRIAQLQNERKA